MSGAARTGRGSALSRYDGMPPGALHVALVVPSVHVRLEMAARLRAAGVHPYLFRSWPRFRSSRVAGIERLLVIDLAALSPADHRDPGTRRILASPRTLALDDVETATQWLLVSAAPAYSQAPALGPLTVAARHAPTAPVCSH